MTIEEQTKRIVDGMGFVAPENMRAWLTEKISGAISHGKKSRTKQWHVCIPGPLLELRNMNDDHEPCGDGACWKCKVHFLAEAALRQLEIVPGE